MTCCRVRTLDKPSSMSQQALAAWKCDETANVHQTLTSMQTSIDNHTQKFSAVEVENAIKVKRLQSTDLASTLQPSPVFIVAHLTSQSKHVLLDYAKL
ncbi:hypothetical protein J6590_068685 [Homalodisca vitripennis]|nr:hypothetical protein J6590_068685 [Homalodisca vitripennis]